MKTYIIQHEHDVREEITFFDTGVIEYRVVDGGKAYWTASLLNYRRVSAERNAEAQGRIAARLVEAKAVGAVTRTNVLESIIGLPSND